MIVGCPNCASKYRLQEGTMGPGGAKMKCPKCGLVFSARAPDDSTQAVAPAPVDTGGAGVVAQADQEWDSMMAGALNKAFAPAPAPSPTAPVIPQGFDPLAEVRLPGEAPPPTVTAALPAGSIPQAPEPRDPFYEANPLVYELPPADAASGGGAPLSSPTQRAVGYASSPSFPAATASTPAPAAHAGPVSVPATPPTTGGAGNDPFAGISLSPEPNLPGPAPMPPTPAAAGASDPFAHISVMTAATTPLAGAGDAAPSLPQQMSAGEIAKVRVKDRAGLIRDFDEISIARGFVTRHTDARGLEISVEGAPFVGVLESSHFANVSMGIRDAGDKKRSEVAAVFPPPAQIPVKASRSSASSGLGAHIAWILAALLFVISSVYTVWQFDLLPVDPGLTQFFARHLGRSSPLLPADLEPGQSAQLARDRAVKAEQQGVLTEAAVFYRAALAVDPSDGNTQESLHRCLKSLGDEGKAKTLIARPGGR